MTWNTVSRKLLWHHEAWGKQNLRLWAGFGEKQMQTLVAAAAAPMDQSAGAEHQLSSICHCPCAQWTCWGCCSDGAAGGSGGWQRSYKLWEMKAEHLDRWGVRVSVGRNCLWPAWFSDTIGFVDVLENQYILNAAIRFFRGHIPNLGDLKKSLSLQSDFSGSLLMQSQLPALQVKFVSMYFTWGAAEQLESSLTSLPLPEA